MPSWREFIPATWQGVCCVCGGVMSAADFDAQDAVAAVGPEGVVACHARHALEDCEGAARKMAAAKAVQIALAELEGR